MKKKFDSEPTYKVKGNTYIKSKRREYGYEKTILHDNKEEVKAKIQYKCFSFIYKIRICYQN